MASIRLEFEQLEILRPKKRWQLYFVIVAEHPNEADKFLITTIPTTGDNIIRIKPRANNLINFEPEAVDEGVNGLFVIEREMPADQSISVRVFLRHSRNAIRDSGEILQNLQGELGGDAFDIVTDILGTTSPWLVVAKKATPLIGGILKKIKDRDFGFVSMDEEFGPEFENQTELDRANNFSTGDARIVWSWSIQD